MKQEYGLIIKTDKYTGNFEREMCAYMTGHTGDCEVGDEESVEFLKEYPQKLAGIIKKPDEHGCFRPVDVHAYHSLIIFFDYPIQEDTDTLNLLKSRANDYADKRGILVKEFKVKSNTLKPVAV